MKRICMFLAGLWFLFLTFLPALHGATVTWVGGSGDWNTAANWSTGSLPGTNDNVVIGAGASITVTHSSGTHTVNSVQSQQAFVLSGGSLTVSNTFLASNTFILSGGTLATATVCHHHGSCFQHFPGEQHIHSLGRHVGNSYRDDDKRYFTGGQQRNLERGGGERGAGRGQHLQRGKPDGNQRAGVEWDGVGGASEQRQLWSDLFCRDTGVEWQRDGSVWARPQLRRYYKEWAPSVGCRHGADDWAGNHRSGAERGDWLQSVLWRAAERGGPQPRHHFGGCQRRDDHGQS